MARNRASHEQIFRPCGGQRSQIRVGVGAPNLEQQVGIVDLFDGDASDPNVAVAACNRCQDVPCVLAQLAHRGGAHVRVPVTPCGQQSVEKSHACRVECTVPLRRYRINQRANLLGNGLSFAPECTGGARFLREAERRMDDPCRLFSSRR
ncbi:MAG: hypothetical protein ACHQ4J_09015 [Candidatus Binatia bacterium]